MKKRILIVDDDLMTLRILKKYLEEEYDVQIEKDGYRFVEKMDNIGTDLILLDVEMPVMNGLQVFDAIVKNSKYNEVPVVFLSGILDPNVVRDVMAKGAAGYIAKNLSKNELLEKVSGFFVKPAAERNVSNEILVVDGNIEVLKDIRAILMNNGYKVKAITSIIEAIAYAKNHHPALMIMGRDAAGSDPEKIFDDVAPMLRSERVPVILMKNKFFEEELLEKVGNALG